MDAAFAQTNVAGTTTNWFIATVLAATLPCIKVRGTVLYCTVQRRQEIWVCDSHNQSGCVLMQSATELGRFRRARGSVANANRKNEVLEWYVVRALCLK